MTTKYINSIQQVSITIANGATTGTATVTAAVGTFFLLFQQNSFSAANSNGAQAFAYVQVSGTTVTATRNSSGANQNIVNVVLVDATSNLVTSVQSGIIANTTTTSNTATISAVTLADSSINILGAIQSNATFNFTTNRPILTLTNSTTVTANIFRRTTAASVAWQVINWNHAALNQATQPFSISWLNALTSTTQVITSAVDPNNSMLLWAGNAQSSASGATDAVDEQMGQITNGSLLTISCGVANSDTIVYNCTVVEFIPGVLTQNAQRGTVATATTTTATATITSAATSKTAVYSTGWLTTDSTVASFGEIMARITQTNATTVTETQGQAGAVTVGFEALTFQDSAGGQIFMEWLPQYG